MHITLYSTLYSLLVYISFKATLVSSKENKKTGTCCSDGLGLNYTLPMFNECKMKLHSNGSMVQTIPKLIPYTSKEAACPRRKSKLGIPPGHRVCRFPDCMNDPCKHGWCGETMTCYECHSFANSSIIVADKDTTTTTNATTTTTTNTTKSTECPVFHTPDVSDTREYTFPGFWIAENVTSFDFMVSANNGAHIGLFASNVSHDRYEIVIGGWDNTDGRIIRATSSNTLLSSRRSIRLSGIPVYNHYELSFANFQIKLSLYGTQQAILSTSDLNPAFAVTYVGMYTTSQGYWKFPTFCQESQE